MASTNKAKPSSPISLRLTEHERQRLEAEAQGLSMSGFIRARLFGTESKSRQIRIPTADARRVAHVLATLGQSELARSLRELSDAARTGALPVTADTERSIADACLAVQSMCAELLAALGLRGQRQP